MLNKNKIGLAFGLFLAVVHAVWSLCVAVIPNQLQAFLDWIFGLHALEPVYVLTAFNLGNAIMLVIMTFVMGYIIGYVFGWAHNVFHKQK